MAAQRKYARIGDKPTKFECTRKRCKWQGTESEKYRKRVDEVMSEHVCPKCGNNEFYGLAKHD